MQIQRDPVAEHAGALGVDHGQEQRCDRDRHRDDRTDEIQPPDRHDLGDDHVEAVAAVNVPARDVHAEDQPDGDSLRDQNVGRNEVQGSSEDMNQTACQQQRSASQSDQIGDAMLQNPIPPHFRDGLGVGCQIEIVGEHVRFENEYDDRQYHSDAKVSIGDEVPLGIGHLVETGKHEQPVSHILEHEGVLEHASPIPWRNRV